MFRKSQDLAQYEAISYRLTREGGVALFHIRMDIPSRRLVVDRLDEYIWDGERPPQAHRQLELGVRLLLRRQQPEQLPLW